MALSGVVLIFAGSAVAGTITYDFNDGTLDGLVPAQTAGYSYNVSGGVLNVSGAAGTGNGDVLFTTPFSVSGDFTATVDATRSVLNSGGDMVIQILLPGPGGFLDIYEAGPSNIFSNTDATRGLFNSASDSNTTVNLKIARVGNTLTTSFSDNGGATYTTLLSATDASFGGPTPIDIFLDQEHGNTGAQSGYFDNLSITSDSVPAPLPSSAWGGLVLLAGLGLMTVVRRRFTLAERAPLLTPSKP
jgi:hypothetical protein